MKRWINHLKKRPDDLIFTVLIVVLIISFFIPGKNCEKFSKVIKNINGFTNVDVIEKAVLTADDGKLYYENLPKQMPLKKSYFLNVKTIKNKKNLKQNIYIGINSWYLSYTLEEKGDVFYKYHPKKNRFFLSGGQDLKVIKIPEDRVGKNIKITFYPNINSKYGLMIPEIVLGNKIDLFYYFLSHEIVGLVFFILVLKILMDSLLNTVIFYILDYEEVMFKMTIPLGFATVAYLLSRSPLFFSMVRKGCFTYALEYISFMMYPFLISVINFNYFETYEIKGKPYILNWIIFSITGLNLFINTLLAFIGKREFIESKVYIAGCLFLSFISFMGIPYLIDKEKYKDIRRFFFISSLPLIIVVIIQYLIFIAGNQVFFKSITLFAISFYIFQNYSMQLKNMYEKFRTSYVSKLNKIKSYNDYLTNLSNRNKYEADIDKINTNTLAIDNVFVAVIDIDGLKVINDNYGHLKGDEIIKRMALVIKNTNKVIESFKAYRIGGDEFVLIDTNVNGNYERTILNELRKEYEKIKEIDSNLTLSFSVGSKIGYNISNFDVRDIVKDADEKMYKEKRLKKISRK